MDSVTYLGGTITADSSRDAEIPSRMSKALATCQKLKVLWQMTDVDLPWKLLVYNAIVMAQHTSGIKSPQVLKAGLIMRFI